MENREKEPSAFSLLTLPRLRRKCRSSVSHHRQAAGFTLLELLIVIALIMLLMGLLIPAFYKVKDGANRKRAQIEAKIIEHASRSYKQKTRHFPAPTIDLEGGGKLVYGTDDDPNSLVMKSLTNSIPPLLDGSKMRWDENGNVINPWGMQYKITFDLENDECDIDWDDGS